MKFQVCTRTRKGGVVSFDFSASALLLVFALVLSSASWLGYELAMHSSLSTRDSHYVTTWQDAVEDQEEWLKRLSRSLSQEVSSMVARLGTMQAELNRIDALSMAMARNIVGEGELAELVGVDADGVSTGLGGFESARDLGLAAQSGLSELEMTMLELSDKIDLRKQQLSALKDYFSTNILQKQVQPAGFPVMKGWISSPFGYRTSPFTGQRTFHYGIDIASRLEEGIRAIGSGVVVYSGKQAGYGNLIEIAHGNGYTTRYAHHKHAFVKKGMTVKKNDVIALIGNEGNSTGPHLHLEVLHNNRHINPLEFIKRNN